jgi:hypothetical protein
MAVGVGVVAEAGAAVAVAEMDSVARVEARA